MRTLKKLAWIVIAIHFGTALYHSVAHEVLSVKASPAQLAFIIPVIMVAPVVAAFTLQKFEKFAMVLLTASMIGSFVFGVYYHFIADTIDHVAHVAHLEPRFWARMFLGTSYLLAISELLGAAVGLVLLLRASTTRSEFKL